MILKIFTDGGSKGNPGPAAIGIVGYKDNTEVMHYRTDIGITTNNIAEYTAVVKALELIKQDAHGIIGTAKDKVNEIKFYSDSQLLVNQLIGLYKVKNNQIRELIFKIRNLEVEVGIPIQYYHIPREKNVRADALVNNW